MTQRRTTEKDEFFLTYLVFKDDQKMLGHSAVGISKKNPDGTFRLIFRVGLFPTHQVQMEDFILDKTGREFYCKQFPITLEEQALILKKINDDRHIMTDSRKNPENKNAPAHKQSIPGGKTYHTYTNNCKDYALSLIEYARKDHKSLRNTGISIPRWSGKLDSICIEKTAQGVCIIHPQGSKGFYIEKLRQYIADREKTPSYLSKLAKYLKKHDRSTKLMAAKKLLFLLQDPNALVSFNEKEYHALKNGRLGNMAQALEQSSFISLMDKKPEKGHRPKQHFYSTMLQKLPFFKRPNVSKDIELTTWASDKKTIGKK